jgi:hypothetical protein
MSLALITWYMQTAKASSVGGLTEQTTHAQTGKALTLGHYLH